MEARIEPEAAGDQELVEASCGLAAELLGAALDRRRGRRRRRDERLHRLLGEPSGTALVFALADRVLRPTSDAAAAAALRSIASGDLGAVSWADRASLRLASAASAVAPGPVVAVARERIRRATTPYVVGLEPSRLRRALPRLAKVGKQPNLNVLGEAILGWEEAGRRLEVVEALLRRPDVDCVSVKISSIAPGLSLVDLDGSVARAAGPLRRLYRAAAAARPHKLVNLDMEEHRDLEVTLELFRRTLAEPDLADLTVGIALQAYLPDTHRALDELLDLASNRHRRGEAPIRIRLVKGANLAMERVEAELRGWPSPVLPSKADTDASFAALLERLVAARADGLIRLGVATHNLFDVALALVLAARAATDVELEMLAGMADEQADALAARQGHLLVYVPVAGRRELRHAIAYLARRLDENATPEGFLRHALELVPGSDAWSDQAARFSTSVHARRFVDRSPRQRQDRTAERHGPRHGTGYAPEPDTDLTVAANRRFAAAALASGAPTRPSPAAPEEVERAVGRARKAAAAMAATSTAERRRWLRSAAAAMAAGRKEAIAAMAAEAGKTFTEADPEVSEAIDSANWYAACTELLDRLEATTASDPLGVVVVASPWNFPYAIAAGGVLAALAAGNAVLLKPSPEAQATGALLVRQLAGCGFPSDSLQLVAALDDEAGEALLRHRGVDGVVLTGAYETARRLAAWAPWRRLLAETSGKNALVVSPTADVDLAVRDLVRSAFGHAGQKCSAASLAIVDASIHDKSPFLRQLADATRTLRVGAATDPATEVGPIVGPMTPALRRALGSPEPGERWLVEPRRLGDRLYAPGVRVAVRPGSWTHRTEWFGPVLGVMRARGLAEATRWQNAVDYGLTAGLHALDPGEQRSWLDDVEAGNCYLNRPTTGAIVGRQPFGGWKRSSYGPTAKAGGPNYLLGLRRWRDRGPVTPAAAIEGYERVWRDELERPVELAGLTSESNELRYRPMPSGVTVRLGPGAPAGSVEKAAALAALVGTPVRFSACEPLEPVRGARVEVEPVAALAAALQAGRAGRLRLLGQSEPGIYEAAADAGVGVLDEPICAEGRVELVRWLREQVISRSLHRYGDVVYAPSDLIGTPGRPDRR